MKGRFQAECGFQYLTHASSFFEFTLVFVRLYYIATIIVNSD
jgi:hypothetical protein